MFFFGFGLRFTTLTESGFTTLTESGFTTLTESGFRKIVDRCKSLA
jgi:hypothetical protein